uniref:Catechol dioxygenase N-terminal domain-containing protein n=1 Tax=Dendroctonus ponderosae TaxID=77166 RepID=A0AAR5QG24_DENPD
MTETWNMPGRSNLNTSDEGIQRAIEDLDISQSELWKGLEYFTDAGQANELGLLAAGLGLEHYLDLRADEADAKAGITGGTPRTIEGPLYVAGAPESVGFARMDDGSEEGKIPTLIIEGFLFGSLNPDVPSLEEYLGEATKIIDMIVDQSEQGLEVLRGASTYTYE